MQEAWSVIIALDFSKHRAVLILFPTHSLCVFLIPSFKFIGTVWVGYGGWWLDWEANQHVSVCSKLEEGSGKYGVKVTLYVPIYLPPMVDMSCIDGFMDGL